MKLWHITEKAAVESILREGLRPNGIGIVYLTPAPMTLGIFWLEPHAKERFTVLEVETGDLGLSSFEGCADWEILCWGHIPAENVRISDEFANAEYIAIP